MPVLPVIGGYKIGQNGRFLAFRPIFIVRNVIFAKYPYRGKKNPILVEHCKLTLSVQETVVELRADAAAAVGEEEEGAAHPRGSRETRNSGRSSERGVGFADPNVQYNMPNHIL